MANKQFFIRLAIVILLCLNAVVCWPATIAYLDDYGEIYCKNVASISDPHSALEALARPDLYTPAGAGYYSEIPKETKIISFDVSDNNVTVNFSSDIIGSGMTESRISAIYDQVRVTLDQFDLGADIFMEAEGKPLYSYLPSVTNIVAPRASVTTQSTETTSTTTTSTTGAALSGHTMTLSPGHGVFYNGSSWTTQRIAYCSPLNQEDFHTLEMCQYLETYLKSDSMTVHLVRCINKSYGNYNTTYPWWEMAACYWLKYKGYPASVYDYYGSNLGVGSQDLNDDIMARPLSANYDGSEIYVSVHTNGLSGDTSATTPSGTNTFYDANSTRSTWATNSMNLAQKISDCTISSLQNYCNSSWTSHGTAVRNSNGNYAEINYPKCPAALMEVAFHDTCGRDAIFLRDNYFRSVAMWGIYKGICNYFGVTPSWDIYSCEYVGDNFPSTMVAGKQYSLSITMRDRGALWNETRQFRLGSKSTSNPFTTQTRSSITGEVAPGSTYSFTISITAPSTPGTYSASWQMLRENVKWFGPTITKTVTVVAADVTAPTVPSNINVTSISTNGIAIQWSPSTDDKYVSGYKVYKNGSEFMTVYTASFGDQTLSPNTQYSYYVKAYDSSGNLSDASDTITRYSLSVPPSTANLTCDKAASKWQSDGNYTFTAVGGFGNGKLAYYRYAWDQSSTHSWTGTEQRWNSGSNSLAAADSGGWYLHVKGYNSDDVENGTLDLGPFDYAKPYDKIGDVKQFADGTPVSFASKVVTASYGSCFYIEEPDRSSGIRVDGYSPTVGSTVNVSGVLSTENGERHIISASVDVVN